MPTSKPTDGAGRAGEPRTARGTAPAQSSSTGPKDRAAGQRRTFALMVLVLCVSALVLSGTVAVRLIQGETPVGLPGLPGIRFPGSAAAANPVTTDITFASARETNLHATVTVPDYLADQNAGNDVQTPLVVMCHGFTGNRNGDGHFQPLADTLAASGIASIRVDFPGNGESEELFTAYTLKNMYDDIESAIEYMKGAYPISTIGLVGHSMGGRVVSLHLSDAITAAALWSPANGNGLDGLEFLDHSPEGRASLHQAVNEAGAYDVSGWSVPSSGGNFVTLSADFVNEMDTSHPGDAIRGYTGALLVAFAGGDVDLLSQNTIDITLQAAGERGLPFTDLSAQFANANHNYQSAAGDEAETAAISESIEGQTAQFFIDALLPAASGAEAAAPTAAPTEEPTSAAESAGPLLDFTAPAA